MLFRSVVQRLDDAANRADYLAAQPVRNADGVSLEPTRDEVTAFVRVRERCTSVLRACRRRQRAAERRAREAEEALGGGGDGSEQGLRGGQQRNARRLQISVDAGRFDNSRFQSANIGDLASQMEMQ